MESKGKNKRTGKPFIIANPIYDTVFKRLMENQHIAKFFLSTILEQPIEDVTVMPQEFTYRLDSSKVSKKGKKKEPEPDTDTEWDVQYYSIFRLDFMATVRDGDGNRRRILIEIQKSWDNVDVMRFRKYLGEQYTRVDMIDGKETVLPITTVYILGNNIAEVDCPCVRVGRAYIDMINRQPIRTKSEFIETLTHDSYVIQAGRISDVRYTTNLDRLLSIFEQKYFIVTNSGVRKEYPYQPEDENMQLITDLLYEMGADPAKRKEIEDEEEALRIVANIYKEKEKKLKDQEKAIEEKDKTIKEKDKAIKEQDKAIKEQDKAIKKQDKAIKDQGKAIKKQDKAIKKQGKVIKEKDKTIEEQYKRIAELERFLRDKQLE
jgi:hypothetical protein